MRTDKQTDRHDEVNNFRNFANMPKNRMATNSVMCALQQFGQTSVMCALQQIGQTSQISKDGMSVVHGICLEILNISKTLLGKIKKWDTLEVQSLRKC